MHHKIRRNDKDKDENEKRLIVSQSRGLMKSRQKKWRDSRSRETDGGEKIAATNVDKNKK